MAWIELHQSLFTHRKTLQASDILGIPEVYICGHMTALWCWALDNAPTGRILGSVRLVARAAQWTGDAQLFVDALTACKFLDETPDGWTIHNWEDYAGRLIGQRIKAKARTRAWRSSQKDNVQVPYADVMRNVHITYDATQPNSTQPNSTEPKKELLAGKPPKRKPHFEPPSPEEAEELFKARGFPGLGVKFVAHYQSQGWKKKGGAPVTDWKACVTTWIENQKSNGHTPAPVAVRPTPEEIAEEETERLERIRQFNEIAIPIAEAARAKRAAMASVPPGT